ncbi:tetratricopeptide repeat protein [Allorhodopirellula heiligendammensis]|uniref:Tetratricopeptide repeat protein n=1 Tax=Allorhodopirellula heiligendammensis TaxID=2714739 RepID=A0A5C6C7F3_9BACT|nr:tetratricopeptide repeat protein [Allorhodopirellula heiligendammensis]TWU19431.1 Tetratricopeptide repeat protein [Allorhodopirellula heiligendammensis]
MTHSDTNRSVDDDNGVSPGSEPSSTTSNLAGSHVSKDLPEVPRSIGNGAQSATLARRYRWKWNGKLLLITGVVVVTLLIAAIGSYYYHSATTASTFMELAKNAEKQQDFEDQAKWLRRYALLAPDDVDAIYQMAIAADKAADKADRASRGQRIDAARQALSGGIGQIGSKDPSKVTDLRVRLIARLIQLGGPWNREAERQISELNAPENDPQAMTSLALALAGEIADGSYSTRDPQSVARVENYWGWLANQPATFVVGSALQQNPRNLDLITHFLFTRTDNAELFRDSRGGASLSAKQLDAIEQQAVDTLRETSTSHAQLVLHRYLQSKGDMDQASKVLRAAAVPARQRLAELSHAQTLENADVEAANEPASRPSASLLTANPMPTAYWDFLAVFNAARLDQETDPEHALEQLRLLTVIEVPSVPMNLLERLYFEYGKLLVSLDRSDEALVAWNNAIEIVGGNSILLPRAIAAVYASQGDWAAADKATQQLADAIDSSEKQLARVTDAELARSERIAQGRQLAAARWQLDVLKSYLLAGQGDEVGAISLLRNVVDSDADIASKDRVDALIHLAGYYANQGVWDASAMALEKAVTLDPENTPLRKLASDAWSRSGNQLNSLRQLDLIESDSSLLNTISEMESRFIIQTQLQPHQQNFHLIRDAAAELKKPLQASLQSPDDLTEAEIKQLRESLHYVEAFELTIPPENVAAEVHLRSPELARQIDELAKQYPDEANLQALAAERLAQAKLDSEAMAALDRLSKLSDRGGVFEPLVRARTLSALGRDVEAAKLLMETARVNDERLASASTQVSVASILQDAAVFASRGRDNELAYQALTAIPDDQFSLQTLMVVAQLAGSLPADSKLLTLNGKTVSSDELYEYWFRELKQREGADGTYWRYLRANQLLEELSETSRGADQDDPRLSQARQLSNFILSLRPRWGDAIALQGRITAIDGDAGNAVTQLRRAIAAGSTNLQTRQLLWQQLIALGRIEEAEQEIQFAEMNSSGQSDRFSATLIDLALKQGDYTKSMDVAKEAAAKHPQDVNAQLVVAATGTTALANVRDAARQAELTKGVEDAIAAATKLAGDEDARVVAANLRLAITLNQDDKVDALIEQIESSDLPEPAQNKLLSQAYLAKQDLEQALQLLVRADELDPTADAQLRLAELYRQLDRPSDEISALRKALQRDQTNDRLRNLLAQKLVARSADGQPVNWQAIGDLLAGSGGGATSNQVMHAILLGSEAVRELRVDAGSKPARVRLDQAKTILQGLVKKQSGDWRTPTRYLASLLQQEPNILKDLSQPELTQIDTEIRALYQRLMDSVAAEASDVYQYASYLLNQKDADDDAKIRNLIKKLDALAGNSLQALEVAARFAERQGRRDQMPGIVDDWAGRSLSKFTPGKSDELNDQATVQALGVLAAAGSSLQRLGFVEESVPWFERAYREFPTQALGPYIVALGQVDKLEDAVRICAEHYAKYQDAQSATLLVEVLLNFKDSETQASLISANKDPLDDASKRFEDNAAFLEGLGTLKMAEGEYDQAAECFVNALKVNPESVRALNNLAMSYAEIPERASEGLGPINTALRLTNQNPELLDTKGVVLMASGRLAEAEATFAEAFAASREPRHLFHVILAQVVQEKESQAARNWRDLDLDKLDPTGLTASERATLKELKAKFESAS